MTQPPSSGEFRSNADFTPREMVIAAINSYFGISDLDAHGVSHTYIEFPSMYYAAAWAHFFGQEAHVRYIAPESNTDRYFNMSIKVLFEF
jgi:hypothetical protein